MLSHTVHPLLVLLPLSVIIAPVGFIMGIAYLAKPNQRDRFSGLVATLVSASIMFLVWFNFLLNG